MNPQGPYQPQTTPPKEEKVVLHSTDPVDHVHHGLGRGAVAKLVRRSLFGLAIIAVLVGGFYGYLQIDSLRKDAQEQLEIARAIDTAKIYRGNGSDIVEVSPAKETIECAQGYTRSGDNCTKNETITVEPKNYACPADYTKSGEGANTKCSKIVGGQTKTIAATQTTSCPAGFQQSGDQCRKSEQTNDRVKSYSCPSGTKQSGEGTTTQCAIVNASSVSPTASCPSGYSASGGSCLTSTGASGSTSYSCPGGYGMGSSNGNRVCVSTISAGPLTRSYSCSSSGAILLSATGPCARKYDPTGPVCTTTKYKIGSTTYCQSGSVVVTENRSCPGGYTWGGSGSMYCQSIISPTASTSYSCPGGWSLSGSTCYQSTGYVYSCPSGFASGGSGAGMSCSKSAIEYKNVIVSEGCPGGFTLTSGKCEKSTTVSVERKASCPAGYTQSGNDCSQNIGGETKTTPPTVTMTKCEDGYKTVGTGNDTKCTKDVTKTESVKKSYTCADGLLKRQTGDVIDCVKVATT